MLSLDRIVIRNFLSVGHIPQSVVLATAPLTLVLGLNLDVAGENSRNGAGKSTLLQAICYALYGDPLTKIKVDNLINLINQQDMCVIIEFTRDGTAYRIERGRKPNLLRFFVDGEDIAKGKNDQTQIDIERVIGMTHTMFLHIVALNTFTLPFLKMRPADQREVIEELMGITQISQLADQLKLEMDSNKDTLRNEEATIKANSDANARIEGVIAQAAVQATEWRTTQDRVLADITARLTTLLEIDFDGELALFDTIDTWHDHQHSRGSQRDSVNATIAAMQQDISRLRRDMVQYDITASGGVTPEISRLRQDATRLRSEAKQPITSHIDRLLAQAERRRKAALVERQRHDALWLELDSLSEQDAHVCSTCGQGLAGTAHLAEVIAALDIKRNGLARQIDRTMTEMDQCEADAVAAENEVDSLRRDRAAQITLLQTQATSIDDNIRLLEDHHREQRTTAETNAATLRTQIASQQQALDTQYRELARLTASDHAACPVSSWASRDALFALRMEREKVFARREIEQGKTNPLQDRINDLTNTLLAIDYTKLNDLTLQLKHEQFLYKLLTSKDSFIRKRIIDQNLSYLNRCLNKYLERLGLPHEVKFLPDLSVEITLSGRSFDFEQLSRGEMNRLILATSWSFRDTWESLNTDINLLFADEVLDQGTDEAGVEAAVEVLTAMAIERRKNIFLISHRESLRSRIDRVLVARKMDQFTSFAEEAD